MTILSCECPLVWYTWGCRLEHTIRCPLWQSLHPFHVRMLRLLRRLP